MPTTSPRPRVRMPAAERRQQVLAAATALISQRGYWGLSLQDVADACGFTMPGLLHHFGTKDNLLIAVLGQRDRLDAEALAARLGVDADLLLEQDYATLGVTLRECLDAIVERNATQREIVRLYSVLQAESLLPEHPAYDFFAIRQQMALRALGQLIPVEVENPEQLAHHLLALLDGLQLQWLRDPEVDLVAAWHAASKEVAGLHFRAELSALR